MAFNVYYDIYHHDRMQLQITLKDGRTVLMPVGKQAFQFTDMNHIAYVKMIPAQAPEAHAARAMPEYTPEDHAEPEDTIVDPDDTHAESKDTLADPVELEDTPAESKDTLADPVELEDTPAESKDTLADPVEVEDTPAESKDTLADPVELEDTPAAHAMPEDTPEESEDTPAELEDTPVELEDTPEESEDTPAAYAVHENTPEAPTIDVELPEETTEKPRIDVIEIPDSTDSGIISFKPICKKTLRQKWYTLTEVVPPMNGSGDQQDE